MDNLLPKFCDWIRVDDFAGVVLFKHSGRCRHVESLIAVSQGRGHQLRSGSGSCIGQRRGFSRVSSLLEKTKLLESCAVLCVPLVVTVGPWQHTCQGREDVVERPGQDYVVLAIQEEHDHCCGITDTLLRKGNAEIR